jgi:Outer membrane protein beta-barrel domain/PDZ domain
MAGLNRCNSVAPFLHLLGDRIKEMGKLVHFALVAFLLAGIASAQSSLPAIDIFGGYSYIRFNEPLSTLTPHENLTLNGFGFSGTVGLFHHLSVEADFSHHSINDCGGVSNVSCSNFSYMFGPRYTFGTRGDKATFFVHGLVGRDSATMLGSAQNTVSDTAVALAAGIGLNYWFTRHIGFQLGPADIFYTNHLADDGANAQTTFRVAAGFAFRFGGETNPILSKPQPQPAPPPPPQPEQPKSESHRSWIRPWHKTTTAPAEGESSETQTAQGQSTTAPAPTMRSAPAAARGMAVHPLGILAAPQEFAGARIVQIDSGGVAEMASLHVGDLITSVDGKPVRTPMELAAELSGKTGKVRIGILRGKFATETEILIGAQ